MSKTTSEQDREYLLTHMECLPWYAQKFIRQKLRKLSPSTLLGYSNDYEDFFTWILQDGGFGSWDKIADIPLSVLERLRNEDIEETFLNHINEIHRKRLESMKNKTKLKVQDMKKTTTNRKISSLRALFYWLSNIAEDDDLNPLLKRNVMAKIELNPIKLDTETKGNALIGKILIGSEIDAFQDFVADGYGKLDLPTLALKKYEHNKERDIAIISLILSSGLRIAEVSNLDINDIDLVKMKAFVIRKGQKENYVPYSSFAKEPLLDYLNIRKDRYNASKSEPALFLSNQHQYEGRRMTKRAMQLMIEKYGKSFGKPFLSAHKLRHSMATRHYDINRNVISLKKQLGHESLETTNIYTHVHSDQQRHELENAESKIVYKNEDTGV